MQHKEQKKGWTVEMEPEQQPEEMCNTDWDQDTCSELADWLKEQKQCSLVEFPESVPLEKEQDWWKWAKKMWVANNQILDPSCRVTVLDIAWLVVLSSSSSMTVVQLLCLNGSFSNSSIHAWCTRTVQNTSWLSQQSVICLYFRILNHQYSILYWSEPEWAPEALHLCLSIHVSNIMVLEHF